MLNQPVGQETEAGGPDRAAPNLEKLEVRPAVNRRIKQRPAENLYVAHREPTPARLSKFPVPRFQMLGLMTSAMTELAQKTNVLCGGEGYRGVGGHSGDVANGLLHLFVTLEAPPCPPNEFYYYVKATRQGVCVRATSLETQNIPVQQFAS